MLTKLNKMKLRNAGACISLHCKEAGACPFAYNQDRNTLREFYKLQAGDWAGSTVMKLAAGKFFDIHHIISLTEDFADACMGG